MLVFPDKWATRPIISFVAGYGWNGNEKYCINVYREWEKEVIDL